VGCTGYVCGQPNYDIGLSGFQLENPRSGSVEIGVAMKDGMVTGTGWAEKAAHRVAGGHRDSGSPTPRATVVVDVGGDELPTY
jgi:hypothetical protein